MGDSHGREFREPGWIRHWLDRTDTRTSPAASHFAADKISKVRELRLRRSRGQFDNASRDKLAHYEASLEMLAEEIPGHELVDQLRLELEAVRSLPTGGV